MEVCVKLKSRAVFLSGERLECCITLTNVGRKIKNDRNFETLAWASVHIQCLRQVSGERTADATAAEFTTSLGSLSPLSGTSELKSTTPKILFCDLSLDQGDSKTFSYEDVVPSGFPPTYHGRHIRYSYRLVFASQRINRPIATLKVPIRVLSVGRRCVNEDIEDDGAKDKPLFTNPFDSCKPMIDANIDDEDSRFALTTNRIVKKATFYDIRASEGKKVGKLCLFKTAFRLGDDVLGMFDFGDVDVDCLQYSVALICEESLRLNPNDDDVRSHCRAVSKQGCQEFCYGYGETSFSLAVPFHATPTFKTDGCQLDWMLRFEFVIAKTTTEFQPFVSDDEMAVAGHEWNGPHKLPVETMRWNLPITLLPAHPQTMLSSVDSTASTTSSMMV